MPHDQEFLPIPGFPGYSVARDLRVMGPQGKLLSVYASNGCVGLRLDGKDTQRKPQALLALALGVKKPEQPEEPAAPMPMARIEVAAPAAQKTHPGPGKTGAYFDLMRQNEELWRENADLREENEYLREMLAHNEEVLAILAARRIQEAVTR